MVTPFFWTVAAICCVADGLVDDPSVMTIPIIGAFLPRAPDLLLNPSRSMVLKALSIYVSPERVT